MSFKIEEIDFSAEDLEQLGTKEKFWFYFEANEDIKWLFKYSRENTGEHWSEKVAECLCKELDIPHVNYEIARSSGRFGIITKNVIPQNCRMVMGNEVLHKHSPKTYPRPEEDDESFVRIKEHTVNRVLGCLDSKTLPPNINAININGLNAGDVFCGYLMLDALISNQDRHHENWAVIVDNDTGEQHLCPSYDHAASLGRELLDSERDERINTKDKNRTIEKFVCKARSELFRLKTDKKPLFTVDAFYTAIEKRVSAKTHWLSKLRSLREDKIMEIFSNIPSEVISETARNFAIKMVLENKRRLLEDERA
ncbi:hypothetical protein [Parendozoicomonas sp. Alg238-R29]|uniref:hypothetical protein n=1 Tax=Parendozoicomonas sp. Alg238-R29 TaxID=2993446 RepID=UPI00248E6AAC|nr:hypothetical protein [Parendozoicomonas sp. Alg238-R29]